jgi:hypothetical protein
MQTPTGARWARSAAAIAAVKLRRARPHEEDWRTIEPLSGGSVPAEPGDWHDACLRFRRWSVGGVWDKIVAQGVAEEEPKLACACIDDAIRGHPEGGRSAPEQAVVTEPATERMRQVSDAAAHEGEHDG